MEQYNKIKAIWESVMDKIDEEAKTYKAAITEHFLTMLVLDQQPVRCVKVGESKVQNNMERFYLPILAIPMTLGLKIQTAGGRL